MKIHWQYEGKRRAVTLPYPESRTVSAPGRCPVCHDMCVLIAHDVKETAIFRPERRALALKHLRERGADVSALGEVEETDGRAVLLSSGEATETFRLMGIDANVGEYAATATAVCARCRTHLGTLHTEFDTLFGRTEDELITSGRYGYVIGGE